MLIEYPLLPRCRDHPNAADNVSNIGPDHLTWLMRRAGLHGVRRGRPKGTTIASDVTARPADLVQRQFRATGPIPLRVRDLTYLRIWIGFAYPRLVAVVESVGRRPAAPTRQHTCDDDGREVDDELQRRTGRLVANAVRDGDRSVGRGGIVVTEISTPTNVPGFAEVSDSIPATPARADHPRQGIRAPDEVGQRPLVQQHRLVDKPGCGEQPGGHDHPDATVDTDPTTFNDVIWGELSVTDAEATRGLTVTGERRRVKQFLTVFPLPEPAVVP